MSRVTFRLWPVCLLAAEYPVVCVAAQRLTAGLRPDERADVFAGTAVRAYRLSVQGADLEG